MILNAKNSNIILLAYLPNYAKVTEEEEEEEESRSLGVRMNSADFHPFYSFLSRYPELGAEPSAAANTALQS